MPDSHDETLDLLSGLIDRARRAGADAADAVLFDSTSISISYRLGKLEHVERSEGGDLGLRVFIGKRMAIVSSSDRRQAALDEIVERAVAMAKLVPEDPYCGIADPSELATELPDLDLIDPVEPSTEVLADRARAAEEAALAVAGVTNSEGASAGFGRSLAAMVASNGFARITGSTGSSVSVSAIAGEGTGMETDYDHSSAVHAGDLQAPETVGRSAGERAVARLGARKAATARVPVVFDPRAARSLLGHLAGAVNGAAIARGTSFLKEKMGEAVFAPGIAVIDDPHIRRGLRSRPCDSEGVACTRRAVIEDGRLTTWLLDLRSARQLGLAPTGHAVRGTSGPPGAAPSNLYLAPGTVTPAELMADIQEGLYVTGLMGSSVNGVTGDYSRGAHGFWIERGRIAHPVNEVTIAGNLKEMYRALVPANDLVLRYGMDAPTVRIDGMMVAGR
ncbi:TldD/PmbA family protein [Inquilinus limosus]|uniref:TldD/PmbA family protein n=1 Tax=Inquilinus limosus TaxID=171674 RepID=UPI0004009F21|nr:metallopeptidase TldD-related protein [Inquilinus limosus]